MSTRTSFRPQSVITNGNMASSITSQVTILQSITGPSYSLSWSGSTPVGTVSVQVSNDYALNPNGTVHNAGTWNTLTLDVSGSAVTSIPVSGNTGTGFIDIQKTNAYAIRLIYTAGSGAGTLQVIFNGKVS